MPEVSTPVSTARAMPPARQIGVDRAHVIAMAVLDRMAAAQVDAERRARKRHLDVVHGERVAREQHVDVAEPDQSQKYCAAAGVDDDRPGDERDPAAVLLDARASCRRRAPPRFRRGAPTTLRCS